MTNKNLTTLTNQETELDLSNEQVAKMVVAANVDNQKVVKETTPGAPLRAAELPTGKTTAFTLKLQTADVANLIRQAEASNRSWRQYLTDRIQEDILTSKVGRAVISQPSSMQSRISGPQGGIVSRGK